METFSLIPSYQPIPFPAPLWMLNALLIVGFYLHAIPMNVALMGGLVSAMFLIGGGIREHAFSLRLGATLATSLPFFVSFAITMGIVPLLFLQLVYGPLFYTSSILMAVPWILVIFLLLSGYYAFYIYTYQRQKLGKRAPWILLAAAALFLTIAFFFSNNMTLMLTPERWTSLYQDDPYGFNLNWGEHQLLPRYLHFVVGATAVTSLVIGCFGVYWHRREKEYGEWLICTAAIIFLVTTLLQFPIGVWFFLSLPQSIMMNFLGGDFNATLIFSLAMIGDFIALLAMVFASRSGAPWPFFLALIATLIVVFLMVIIRHLVRVYYTQPFFSPENFSVDPQWILIAIFFGSAAVLSFYLAWLIKITWQAFHPPAIHA